MSWSKSYIATQGKTIVWKELPCTVTHDWVALVLIISALYIIKTVTISNGGVSPPTDCTLGMHKILFLEPKCGISLSWPLYYNNIQTYSVQTAFNYITQYQLAVKRGNVSNSLIFSSYYARDGAQHCKHSCFASFQGRGGTPTPCLPAYGVKFIWPFYQVITVRNLCMHRTEHEHQFLSTCKTEPVANLEGCSSQFGEFTQD